ncbi:LacI family DNA-binding transcriptional regulator [Jiangella alba]|uniref:Transcriptional regulator, LacI family n=1 Tax=Jiangella alba TaxID=561176 RepID=A0A1H5JD59_9ACTN|nr:LacI family DNA-binding transcriptional regulator [Jiangella alba]SEE50384.1 transcriptional regulator, LacI family [Jiangella alba]
MTNSPTYLDLQRITGLSLSTISKYYAGGNVLARNRQAIEAAANEIGYRINLQARALRSGRTSTIGVLLPGLDATFHLSIIQGAEATLGESGFGIVVSTTSARPSGVEFLLERVVDGIIAVPEPADEPELIAAAARGVPVVLVDRPIDGIQASAVVLDNRHAVQTAVDALVAAGHSRIALICGLTEFWTMRERKLGFQEALRTRGIEPEGRLIRVGPISVEFGRAACAELLQEAEHTRPTAVICVNDLLTVGAVQQANFLGLRMPDDFSLIAFDAPQIASVTTPTLHVFEQPSRQIADEAARLIGVEVNDAGPHTPRIVVLRGRLVPGGSVGPPPSLPAG